MTDIQPQHQWDLSPANRALPDTQVHVWAATIDPADARVDDFIKTLSKDELHKCKQFRFEEDQRRYVLSRGFLRQILATYLCTEPRELIFHYGPFGKPQLAQPEKTLLRFNLSHSGSVALIAISRNRELGVDVERICVMAESDVIARGFFSTKEKLQLHSMPAEQKNIFFYRCWTRKEAILKCRGEGLGQQEIQHLTEHFEGVLCDLLPAHGYAASLAVIGPAFELKTWRWTKEQTLILNLKS